MIAALAGPFDEPKKLPPLPEPYYVQFLKEDIWKIYNIGKQCMGESNKKLCVDARTRDEKVVVNILFTWRF